MYKTRETCRICEGSLADVLDLGDIYLSTFLSTNEENPPKAPLDLVRCIDCNLFQLRDTVDQDFMYSNYWYQSGLNASMREALSDVVHQATTRVELQDGDVVVDIGANDGTLLKNYSHRLIRVAYEPSDVGDKIDSTSADVVFSTYFTAEPYRQLFTKKAKIITAIAVFYDLEDPHSFVKDIKAILHEDGVFIIQMMDLKSMLETGDFPNLCHEHLEYYSLDVLDQLLLKHRLEIVDVEYNKVNGGSLRVYVKHDSFGARKPSVMKAFNEEDAFFATNAIEKFQQKVLSTKNRIINFINYVNSLGYKVAVMGASTKGNTMLQYFGLTDKDIDHAAEVNPDKFGLRTVGSNIPIISEEESLTRKPDYYFLLPWGFTDFFVKKLHNYLESGICLISPLPEPRVIYMERSGNLCEDIL